MNEEEAELLPPYLRPYPPAGAPLGTLSYNRRSKCWVVKGDPSVTEVCKRLFPGSAGSRRGEARFTAHRRAVGDLCWLMMRFPLEIKASDRALWEKAVTGAREYAVRQAKLSTMPVRMTPPDGAFLGTLRPFQEEGLSYLCSHDRCLLADEMVTPQLRALVRRLEEFANNGKVGGLILRGGELTLYQVASVKRTNGNLYFDYTGDFTGCGVVLGDLSDSTLADQLVKYLPAVPAIAAQQDVNEEGYANITKLPQGLYLVVQTEASHGYEAIKPFLVSIPMPDGDNWIYDVDATPKVGATIPETPDTPDTPDVPDTPPDTPDTPDLPEQPDTPDTPVSPGTPDNPVSPDSPDNPVSPENPDNPVSPSNPDKPVLPQTGQLNWPVPVLACSGVLLFAAGWVLNRQGKKEN